jgi:uncharacterized phage protein gp47/JayE
MPFSRPTLADLIERSINDIEARLPGVDAKLRRSNLNVLSRVHAGAVHGLYGYLDWLSRQVIYDTAEAEILDRWATIWLSQPRKAATPATGNVTFVGTNGALVPSGTVLLSADGTEYSTSSGGVISGTATVAAVAYVAGVGGNADAGASLNMVLPISGINGTATIAAGGMTGGSDIESDTSLRARLIARIQQPPHGGSEHDYIAWALEVPGVTRVWVYPQENGLGTVVVRFMRDGDASPIPDTAEVAAVQAYIDERRPVTAMVGVVAPVAAPLNFTILPTPNTAAVKAAIEAELADLLLREAEPGGTILLSHIRAAISTAAGETNYTMTAPSADVTHTTGQIATMGTLTWA